MIIDSHCHLTYEPMSSSLDETIRRANNEGVKYLLTISTEDKSFKNILEIVKNYNSVYGTYGIHPHEAKKHKEIKSDLCLKQPDKVVEWMRNGTWTKSKNYGEGSKNKAGFPKQPTWFEDARGFKNLESGLKKIV